MLEVLFWLSLIGAVYSYFIYPFVLLALSKLQAPKKVTRDEEFRPKVSLIIAAYNEQANIAEKIQNSLAIDYPRESLEIIVASDCSSDDTDAIVNGYAEQGIKLVRAEERLGKENAQLSAIQQASGELLVFSDVATTIPEDALLKLTSYFADPQIGALSSEDRFLSQDGEIAGEGAYVKYEMWLRKLESGLAGLVGLSGSFFAARREVCEHWDIYATSDFNIALQCSKVGLRAITAPDVLGYYPDLKDPQKEYARKTRTIIHGISALARHPQVLNPLSFGMFAFQVISHKLMRWAVPWLLLLVFISNALCWGQGGLYPLLFVGQLLFYGVVIAAHYKPSLKEQMIIRLAYYFVQVNLAIFDASCQFMAGRRVHVWEPSAR